MALVIPIREEVPKMRAFVERCARLGLRGAAALAFVAPLLTRITLGHAFFLTGRGKLANFDTFVSFLAEQGVPMPVVNAHVVARLEYYGGILLVVGLLTRLVAAALAGTMVVALLTERHQFFESWRFSGDVGPTDISSFVFLILLAWLVLFGPGVASLDALITRGTGVGRGDAPARSPGPA
jgi:putative oxidoreductase